MGHIRVYLEEAYEDIEEGTFFGVEFDQLWDSRSASHKEYKGMIKVLDESEEEYWIYEDDLKVINSVIRGMF